MIAVREGGDRRHLRSAGRETWFSVDPHDCREPLHDGFRALVGLVEDRLAPGTGFPTHSHREAELILYLRAGVLGYQNDLGHSGIVRAGEFQHVSAGRGIRHRRFNASPANAAHAFEIRLRPDTLRLAPDFCQRRFSVAERKGRFCLVGSPQRGESTFRIHQDVWVYSSLPQTGHHLIHPIAPGRVAWLHVVSGRVRLDDREPAAGDDVAVWDEASVSITALEPSELLLLDLGCARAKR